MKEKKRIIKSGIFRTKRVVVKRRQPDIEVFFNGVYYFEDQVIIHQRYRKGDMIAFKEDGTNKVYIGFSLCDDKDLPFYDKKLGQSLAEEIAINSYNIKSCPSSIKVDLAYFTKRCLKYFQNCEVPIFFQNLMEQYCED